MGKYTYSCPGCNKTCKGLNKCTKHVQQCSSNSGGIFDCPSCGANGQVSTWREHILACHKRSDNRHAKFAKHYLPSNLCKCPACNVVQGPWAQCQKHMKRCCPRYERKIRNCRVTSSGSILKCPGCGGSFEQAQTCVSHISDCSPDTLRGCKWPPNAVNGLDKKLEQVGEKAANKRLRAATKKLSKVSSRSKVSTSADGTEAVVKKVAGRLKCSHESADGSRTLYVNQCPFAVDLDHLFQLRCTKCNQTLDMSHEKAEYLWCRRRTRKTLGLLSVSAPLDGQSFWTMDNTAKSCGIVSNTTVAHLTFAEGYRLPTKGYDEDYAEWFESTLSALEAIRLALHVDPSVTITSLHTVPRQSNMPTVLVVADVSVSPSAYEAAQKIRSNHNCALPQFPLHVAVGACPATSINNVMALASQRLIGLKLTVDAVRLSVLAPSLDSHEKFLPTSTRNCDEKRAKRLKQNEDLFGDAIDAATNSANQINQALFKSAYSMYSWTIDRAGSSTEASSIVDFSATRVESKLPCMEVPADDDNKESAPREEVESAKTGGNASEPTTIKEGDHNNISPQNEEIASLEMELNQCETKIDSLRAELAAVDHEIESSRAIKG